MSNVSFLFSLAYLNIFGIFCFSYRQNQIKISRFWKFYCILKILITFSFQTALYHRIFNVKSVVVATVPHLRGFSNFTIFLLLFTNFSMVFSTTSINLLAFKRCRSVEMLLNQAIELYQTLDLDFKNQMRKMLRNLNCLAIVLSILFTRLVLTVLKKTTFSVLLGCVLIPIPITFWCFLCLLKGSQLFLEILLQNFNKNLMIKQNMGCPRGKYSALTKKYQKLHEFSSEINKVFGIQITMVTSALSVVATLNVRHPFLCVFTLVFTVIAELIFFFRSITCFKVSQKRTISCSKFRSFWS